MNERTDLENHKRGVWDHLTLKPPNLGEFLSGKSLPGREEKRRKPKGNPERFDSGFPRNRHFHLFASVPFRESYGGVVHVQGTGPCTL